MGALPGRPVPGYRPAVTDDLIHQMRAKAARLRAEGQAKIDEAAELEAMIKRLEARARAKALRGSNRSDTVSGVKHLDKTRRQIASAREASPRVKELRDTYRLTLRELHRKLMSEGFTTSQPHLTRIFRGDHPCPPDLSDAIERLTRLPDKSGIKL